MFHLNAFLEYGPEGVQNACRRGRGFWMEPQVSYNLPGTVCGFDMG